MIISRKHALFWVMATSMSYQYSYGMYIVDIFTAARIGDLRSVREFIHAKADVNDRQVIHYFD